MNTTNNERPKFKPKYINDLGKRVDETKPWRVKSTLMRWLSVLLIATAFISCDETEKQDWKYEIGELAVHKLTADTVIVTGRHSMASGVIEIRHKDCKVHTAREEELQKIPQ